MDSFMSSDPTDEMIIEEQIEQYGKTLHALRTVERELTVKLNEAKLLFDLDNIATINALNTAKTGRVECEAQLREVILSAYQLTDSKHFIAGDIRNETEVTVTDTKAALAWAIEHKMALALDTKQATALAKTGMEIPGVTVSQVAKATIKSDLGKALGIE